MDLQNVSFSFISRFHFHYPPQSTHRKWCLFAIQKITKAIFATPTKQFLLADEQFSSKTHITQQHGITEREYCVYLTFSFLLSTTFNGQEVMFVCDSKDSFRYLCDTNKTIFASRWSVFFKNPHNSAAWNYRTWVLRLSHVFIFYYPPHSTDRKWCLFAIQKITKAIFATPTKQFLLADEEFSSKKNQNKQAAWNYRTWVLRLPHVFNFISDHIHQTGSDVCLRFKW